MLCLAMIRLHQRGRVFFLQLKIIIIYFLFITLVSAGSHMSLHCYVPHRDVAALGDDNTEVEAGEDKGNDSYDDEEFLVRLSAFMEAYMFVPDFAICYFIFDLTIYREILHKR